MSKFKIFVFIISLFTIGVSSDKASDKPISLSDIPQPWYIIPVHPNSKAVPVYGDGAVSEPQPEQGMISWVADTVYGYTLGPVVSIASTLMTPITAPLGFMGGLVGIGGGGGGKSERSKRDLTSSLMQWNQKMQKLLYEYTIEPFIQLSKAMMSPFMGPMRYMNQIAGKPLSLRKRRDVEPNEEPPAKTGTDSPMVPFEYLSDILVSAFIKSLTTFYEIMLSSVNFMFGYFGLVSIENNSSNNTGIINDSGNNTGSSHVMDYINQVARDATLKFLINGWKVLKSDLLPLLDKFSIQYQDSDLIPDELKTAIKSFHTMYSMAHTLQLV